MECDSWSWPTDSSQRTHRCTCVCVWGREWDLAAGHTADMPLCSGLRRLWSACFLRIRPVQAKTVDLSVWSSVSKTQQEALIFRDKKWIGARCGVKKKRLWGEAQLSIKNLSWLSRQKAGLTAEDSADEERKEGAHLTLCIEWNETKTKLC